jgi:hypothetical protein
VLVAGRAALAVLRPVHAVHVVLREALDELASSVQLVDLPDVAREAVRLVLVIENARLVDAPAPS